jgi:hypothetical protein
LKWATSVRLPYVTVWSADVTVRANAFKRWSLWEGQLQTCQDWQVISGGTNVARQYAKITNIAHTAFAVPENRVVEIQGPASGSQWVCYSHRVFAKIIADFDARIIARYDTFDNYLYSHLKPWVILPFLVTSAGEPRLNMSRFFNSISGRRKAFKEKKKTMPSYATRKPLATLSPCGC